MATIVPVTQQDIPTLSAISRETFAATFAANTAPADMQRFLDSAYSEDQLARELCTQGTTFWFIKVDAKVAGYLKLNVNAAVSADAAPNGLELERIYIRTAFKHQGLGTQLFKHAEAIARAAHKSSINLGVWEGNTAAQIFYKRLGFHRIGQHVFQVGTDPQTDWLMQKILTDTTITATSDLSSQQLLEILAARTRVFVVEQHCPYQEVDDADKTALHVTLRQTGKLVAYARILPAPNCQPVRFGRVLVAKEMRGMGLAKQLVATTLATIASRFPSQPVQIQAQAYLRQFYGSFGFVPVSDIYLEDGIPHIDMVLQK